MNDAVLKSVGSESQGDWDRGNGIGCFVFPCNTSLSTCNTNHNYFIWQICSHGNMNDYTGQQIIFIRDKLMWVLYCFSCCIKIQMFRFALARLFFVMKVNICCMIFGIITPRIFEDFLTVICPFVMQKIHREHKLSLKFTSENQNHLSHLLYCRNPEPWQPTE